MERGRIIVNNIDYTGSFVTPNPSEPPTKDLNTLEIEGEVFNIAGGGSGGSAYREAVLWSGNSSTNAWASPVTMSLNDSIRKYDELIIQFSDNSLGYAFVNIPTRDIPSDYAEKYFTNTSFVYKDNLTDAETGYILVTADDEILGYTATGTTVTYTKVIGRKFGGNLSPIIYSTEEREVGVWIDNKPLYQKTFDCGALLNAQTKEISFTEDMEMATIIDAFAMSTNEGYIISLPDVVPNYVAGSVRIYVSKTAKKIYIYSQADMRTYDKSYVTIQYTKTTDVAGSGEYNTLGIPNVHYDGNEKIIGTFFGKTLYQKSEHIILSTPISPNTDTTVNFSNFSNITSFLSLEAVGGLYGNSDHVTATYGFWEQSTSGSSSGDRIIKEWDMSHMVVRTGSNYNNFPSAGVDNRIREFWVTMCYTKD